jgi:hypothetical protein
VNDTYMHDSGNYRVVVKHDDEPDSPRQEGVGNVGYMVCLHDRYSLGDEGDVVNDVASSLREEGMAVTATMLQREFGVQVVLPLYLLDHSGLSMTAGSNVLQGHEPHQRGWDTSVVGIIFDHPERMASALADPVGAPTVEGWLRSEVAEYDLWLRGEAYVLEIEQRVREHVEVTSTWPDGSITRAGRFVERWEPLPDGYVSSVLGSQYVESVAKELLGEVPA